MAQLGENQHKYKQFFIKEAVIQSIHKSDEKFENSIQSKSQK